MLHFVLENPLLSLPSYTCNTIRMEGLKATDYFTAILRGFHFINIANINIGTVVFYGGTTQKKAFKYKWKDSIRNCGNSDYKNIIFVPCLCHLISNSYIAQAAANIALKNVVDKLNSYSHLWRINIKQIKAQCPAHIDKRWIYDYNISSFILKKKKKMLYWR